jgi:mannobiose 2-epimerase
MWFCVAWSIPLLCVKLAASAQSVQPVDAVGLLQHLTSEFIPFFLERTPDTEFGGYHANVDPDGTVHVGQSKGIIPQSRQLYMFSAGARRTTGEQRARFLEAAHLGKTFITGRMLDPVHGGFWERVTRDGRRAVDPIKNTYGQAFAIYALTEFALASGDRPVLAAAVRAHDIVRGKMWERDSGGLFRTAEADWTVKDDRKKIDDHLHFLEAVWNLYAARKDPPTRNEIGELSGFILRAFFSGPRLEERELVHRDLSPAPDGMFRADRTGHSMESAWFLLRAARLLGREDFRRAALIIVDRVIDDRFDWEHGGIASRERDAERTWWVQCEGVAALALAWRDTGQARYQKAFEKALSFTLRAFPDRKNGGWYPTVSRSGREGRGNKAGEWKAGYHETQMLAYVADILAGQDPDAGR